MKALHVVGGVVATAVVVVVIVVPCVLLLRKFIIFVSHLRTFNQCKIRSCNIQDLISQELNILSTVVGNISQHFLSQ